jgi:hypothetical protein
MRGFYVPLPRWVSLAPATLGNAAARMAESESIMTSEVFEGSADATGLHSKAMRWGSVGQLKCVKSFKSFIPDLPSLSGRRVVRDARTTSAKRCPHSE